MLTRKASLFADFEGGIRVAAFVGGGFLPVHNTSRDGYIHAADWYPTVCLLAGGHDCREMAASSAASVPAVDGVRTTLSLPPVLAAAWRMSDEDGDGDRKEKRKPAPVMAPVRFVTQVF